MTPIFVHVNCKDYEEAKEIADFLLEANLIACANIQAPHTGIYVWENETCYDQEVSMILKTALENYKEIERAVLKRHSYDCPPICYWRIDGGYPSYLAWIKKYSV